MLQKSVDAKAKKVVKEVHLIGSEDSLLFLIISYFYSYLFLLIITYYYS